MSGILPEPYAPHGRRDAAAHRFCGKAGFCRIDPAELPPPFPRMVVDSRFYRLHLPDT